jgi:hypothetical protein
MFHFCTIFIEIAIDVHNIFHVVVDCGERVTLSELYLTLLPFLLNILQK